MTDLSNAELFAKAHSNSVRWCPPRCCWYRWDGRRWTESGANSYAMRLAMLTARNLIDDEKEATKSEAVGRLNAMLKLAGDLEGMLILPHQLDVSDSLLNLRNGTLDLETMELRPHTQSDLMTRLADVDHLPGAESSEWNRFVATITGGDDELQSYLSRVIGYCLQGGAVEKCLFLFSGAGDTGKSTFLNAIAETFGDYALPVDVTTWLVTGNAGGNRGDIVRTMGVRLVYSGEPPPGARYNSSLLKQYTGQDLVTAAAKYEKEISFVPRAKVVMACNDSPSISGGDQALWNRMRRVPFPHVIPRDKQDRALARKLATPESKSAILWWAVQGLVEWRKSGLGTCRAVEESTQEYRLDEDYFATFLADNYEVTGEEFDSVGATDLRLACSEWCRREGHREMSAKLICQRLIAMGCKRARTNRIRLFRGIRSLVPTDSEFSAPKQGVSIPTYN